MDGDKLSLEEIAKLAERVPRWVPYTGASEDTLPGSPLSLAHFCVTYTGVLGGFGGVVVQAARIGQSRYAVRAAKGFMLELTLGEHHTPEAKIIFELADSWYRKNGGEEYRSALKKVRSLLKERKRKVK